MLADDVVAAEALDGAAAAAAAEVASATGMADVAASAAAADALMDTHRIGVAFVRSVRGKDRVSEAGAFSGVCHPS